MKLRRFFLIFVPILLVTCLGAICLGSTALSLRQIADGLLGRGDTSVSLILRHIRLPRVAAGLLAGIGLGISGVLLQTVTANDLASPNIIGINSGAGLAVILMLTFFPKGTVLLPAAAFAGAFLAALLILLVSSRFGSSRTFILLIGIAITTLFNAAISFLSLLDEGVLAEYNHFTVGSLKGIRMQDLGASAVLIVLAFLGALGISGRLRLLCLGDNAASALGIKVKQLRLLALGLAAASSAAVVSFAGLLGFVGLVVPHIARAQLGQNPRRMLCGSAVLGAIVVILADLLGRTLFAPSELPVGVLMSAIGAPYFLLMLLGRKRNAALS